MKTTQVLDYKLHAAMKLLEWLADHELNNVVLEAKSADALVKFLEKKELFGAAYLVKAAKFEEALREVKARTI